MERRRVRIGDVIDDYCTRCRLIMNHGVAAMVDEDVRKVRCNTCGTEHVYKHGKVPARKRRETEKLFAEVLRGMGREPGDDTTVAEPEPDESPDADEAGEDDGAHVGASADADTEPEGGDIAAAGDPDATQPVAAADADADRLADSIHGVRRKLYTIRRFSGGKAPAGGGPTDGVGGKPPVHGAGIGSGQPGGHAGGSRHGGGRHGGGGGGGGGGGRHGGGRHRGGRHGRARGR